MKTTLSHAEKFLALLSASPEAKVLLDREKNAEAAAKKQARIDCLTRIQNLQLLEIEAKQKLDLSMAAIIPIEAKLNELKTSVAIAAKAHVEAQLKRGKASTELVQIHGEGAVQNTLYKLDRLIKKTESDITGLNSLKNPYSKDEYGQFIYRPIDPGITTRMETSIKRLTGFNGLYEEAKKLINSEISPDEIWELCESICDAIGQPLRPTEIEA
jgi:hypothetical protein